MQQHHNNGYLLSVHYFIIFNYLPETFLLLLWMQVPRYIITIHQLLAHTPHDHVERRSLEFALGKLEEISQVPSAVCSTLR